jgi:formylglycine-generating enzyme required for sulfatase activity
MKNIKTLRMLLVLMLLSCGHSPSLSAANVSGKIETSGFTNYVQKIPGSTVTFEMVAIPGGSITIGSYPDETGREATDSVRKRITVKPFWMGKYEVRWNELAPYVYHGSYWSSTNSGEHGEVVDQKVIIHPTRPYGSVYRERGERGYPALGMGLPLALEYCRWISIKTGHKYRLPTEEEWEYACRAGSTNAYFWGNDPARAREYGWFLENSSVPELMETTHPCGKLKPNPFGLFDIVGNVAEWCLPAGNNAPHVVRGGSFSNDITQLRCSARLIETPEWDELDPQSPPDPWFLESADFVGFRLVRSLDEESPSQPAKTSK